MTKAALSAGNKRGGSPDPWQKVKFDRQIIAIGKVNSATAIYSDDAGLVALAKDEKMKTVSVGDLDIPSDAAQTDWVTQASDQATKEGTSSGE